MTIRGTPLFTGRGNFDHGTKYKLTNILYVAAAVISFTYVYGYFPQLTGSHLSLGVGGWDGGMVRVR